MNLQNVLPGLRQNAGLSQEKLAAELNVSRQAVQKWESGTALPDLDNAIHLAKFFGVSLDLLLGTEESRPTSSEVLKHRISPDYTSMHVWEDYSRQLDVELQQSLEEGKDMEPYRALFEAVSHLPASQEKQKLADVLFDLVQAAPQRADYPYNEPSDLAGIFACRPENRPGFGKVDADVLRDKLQGAWFGRICGCLLGKPVEGMRTDKLVPMLKQSGNYPMHRYITSADVTEESWQWRCWIDKVNAMPVDDDTNYMVLAMRLIDRYGLDFTPMNMAEHWLAMQPKNAYCTAERVAFCNFVRGYTPPSSAEYKNPYREWIGAQIRGDYFGYIYPGNPEAAADLAWRDASISHVKNGIYGEMWASAMIAAAAVTSDIREIIEAGLGQIPANCRLTEGIRDIIDMYERGESEEACFAHIHEVWDEYSSHGWCHTISNAMIVTAALLYGKGDYGRSICMAVETGFDTDCNGATVGSVLGMRGGMRAIPEVWTAPINDTLKTTIFGYESVSITEMAKKTFETAVK
ncbi:MAG: ADP-ribosylglycohydrolase family protein [Clostridia bacterium]|nr:ADP-ribosylglycohydrolase family protein [Clostridia bacterium]